MAFLPDWNYRYGFIIDSSLVDDTLTNFPILIKLDSTLIDFSQAKADGTDIRFTLSDGTTLLDYERIYHDNVGETAQYRVKIPSVSSSVDTEFFIYWGNAAASDGEEKADTWSQDYGMVCHLNGDINSVNVEDALGATNGIIRGGSQSDDLSEAGKMYKSFLYDGIADYVEWASTGVLNAQRPMTASSWIKRVSTANPEVIFNKRGKSGTTPNRGWAFSINGSDQLSLTFYNVAIVVSTGTIVDTDWHRVSFALAADGTINFYIDEAPAGSDTLAAPSTNNDNMALGAYHDADGNIAGYTNIYQEEAILSDVERAPEWEKACYYSEMNELLLLDHKRKYTYSDTIIKHAGEQEEIDSDGKIINGSQESIDSDAKILGTSMSSTGYVSATLQQAIYSSTIIVTKVQESIESDTTIKREEEQSNIDSDAYLVKVDIKETIDSDTRIFSHEDFHCSMRASIDTQEDFNCQLKVGQAVPAEITNLTATDPQTGESIILDWDEDSSYGYNIYKDVGAAWVLQNEDMVITDNSYTVGSLTTDVTYTFLVRGVNGVGVENTGEEVEGTPTYSINRYTDPSFEIKIGGVTQENAILTSVNMQYGPQLSTANFYIPEDPRTVGLPEADASEVLVYINNYLTFTGNLTKRSDIYAASSLEVRYTAVHSGMWDGSFETMGFDVPQKGSAGGVSYDMPNEAWSDDSVSMMTTNQFWQFIGRYKGNYKLLPSRTGDISLIKATSVGSARTYAVGKHILEYNKEVDITDKVNKVTMYSNRTTYTHTRSITFSLTPISGAVPIFGPYEYVAQLTGRGISNVQVYGKVNEKPTPTVYSKSNVSILPSHIPALRPESDDEVAKWPDGSTESKQAIVEYEEAPYVWRSVGADTVYDVSGNKVRITLSSIPKTYSADVRQYTAYFKAADKETGEITDQISAVNIWMPPKEHIGARSYKVTYTEQTDRKSSISGSGTPERTIVEGVTPVADAAPTIYGGTGAGNSALIQEYIDDKCAGVYERVHISKDRGTMKILGDETISLTDSVNGVPVERVTHSFGPLGFITQIHLTKEANYRGESVLKDYKANVNKEHTRENKSSTVHLEYSQGKYKTTLGNIVSEESDAKNEKKSGGASATD